MELNDIAAALAAARKELGAEVAKDVLQLRFTESSDYYTVWAHPQNDADDARLIGQIERQRDGGWAMV